MRTLFGYAAAAAALASACLGQTIPDTVSFKGANLAGLHIYGASVYSGYSSSAYPLNSPSQVVQPGIGRLGSDEIYGATASLGWHYDRQHSSVSAMYSGTYGGMIRNSNLNAYSQSLSFSASRTVRKWTFTFSGSGQDSTFAQYLFQPSALDVVTQLPTNFDDLAAAFSVGNFSSAQIAAMLTGAPLLSTPARSLLLGDRVLSYSAQLALNYAYSTRLSFHFGGFGAAGQHRAGKGDTSAPNYLIPHTVGGNAGLGLSYMLSPRTQIGFDVEEGRQNNRYMTSYTTTATASFARKMGIHWFTRVYAGGSYTDMVRSTFNAPITRQIVGGGTLGFRTRSNTLAGTYDRTAMNGYGYTTGTTTNTMGSWAWNRRGSRWSLFAGFGQEQVRSTGFLSITGWQSSAGASAYLGAQMMLTAQYSYLDSTGKFLGTLDNVSIHSVRLTLGWVPQHGRHQ
jgi:hypothetical protein